MKSRKPYRILALLIAFAVCITSVLVLPLNDVSAASIKKSKKQKQRTASLTLVTKGSGAFDYRSAAGEKLYGYDTLQGACANAGYAYLTLYNRNVENCKIVKVNLSTR